MRRTKIRARGHRDSHTAGGNLVETLESRRLFSVAMDASLGAAPADGLVMRYTYLGDANTDGDVIATDFNTLATNFGEGQPIVTQSVSQLPPIKGTYTGSYTAFGDHKYHMTLVVASHTHTGHFTGNAVFASPAGNEPAQFNGKVTTGLHVHIDFAGKGFSGTLTGTTTHTGGQISGSLTVTGGVNTQGTYKVIKP